MFSDESTFSQFQQGSCSQVWRKPSEEFQQDCLSVTVKHSPSRMHWGCFCYHRLGLIIPLQGSVTGAMHAETLQKHAIPALKRFYPKGNGVFQEDNATPHTARIVAAVCDSAGIKTLTWSPQSLDLNPIENIWHEMKMSICQQNSKPTSLSELEQYVKEAQKSISSEYYKKLIDSMPDCIKACIEAKGYITKYQQLIKIFYQLLKEENFCIHY